MKSGLAVIVCLLAVFCSAQVQAATQTTCQTIKPYKTEIVINLEVPDPYYDFTKNKNQVNAAGQASRDEWLARNNMHGVWSSNHMTTLGQASGGWAANYSWNIEGQPLDQYGAYSCIFVKRIEVNMMFRTMIIIPKDYPRKSCDFEVIHEHELRHYDVNRRVALKTAMQLEKDMPVVIMDLEQDYIGRDKVEGRFEEIKKSVQDLVEVYFKQVMSEEMDHLNNLIDTPEEYSSHKTKVAACEERRKLEQQKAPKN